MSVNWRKYRDGDEELRVSQPPHLGEIGEEFYILRKEILFDEELTERERLIACALQTLGRHCIISTDDVAEVTPFTVEEINAASLRLEERGYCRNAETLEELEGLQ